MTGKWITLISVFVFVMVGLVGAAFVLNWLTARFIGPSTNQVNPVEERKERIEEHKEKVKEHDTRVAERLAKEKHSPAVLAEIAREAVPEPLSAAAFDPLTGKVVWPELLLASEYEEPRLELDRLLKHRAGNPGDDSSAKAHEAAEQMFSILKEHVRDVPANDYIAVHKFLDSLAYMLRP